MSTTPAEHTPDHRPSSTEVEEAAGWERYAAAVLADLDEAVVLLDESGTILSWNAAAQRILGYETKEMIGQKIRTIVPRDRRADLLRVRRELDRFGHVNHLDTAALAKGGETVPIRLTETRLDKPTGGCAGYSLVMRDLREREELERQLVRADRLATIGLLASTVAHEVGTPLNVILGRAEMLGTELSDNPVARRQIDAISTQIQRISDVVARLLTFSREAAPGAEPVDINRILTEVVTFVAPRVTKHRIELISELDETLPNLTGSTGHFHQIFLNLVMNAIDAMPTGGTLTVRTSSCSGAALSLDLDCHCLRAEIIDTGRGIKPADLKRIFDPFFTTKTGGKGTGLGLAISEEIVRKYEGQIQVQSTPEEGTRFLVNLPAIQRPQRVVT